MSAEVSPLTFVYATNEVILALAILTSHGNIEKFFRQCENCVPFFLNMLCDMDMLTKSSLFLAEVGFFHLAMRLYQICHASYKIIMQGCIING